MAGVDDLNIGDMNLTWRDPSDNPYNNYMGENAWKGYERQYGRNFDRIDWSNGGTRQPEPVSTYQPGQSGQSKQNAFTRNFDRIDWSNGGTRTAQRSFQPLATINKRGTREDPRFDRL